MNMKKPKYKPGDTVRLWRHGRGLLLFQGDYPDNIYAKGPNQMGKMPFFVVTVETFTERVQE
jgi:hypothetical protein